MIEILKSLFGKKNKVEYTPDPPGRTFNRILTGKYFGCNDIDANESCIIEAKQNKIDQITELELTPMFIRYSYKDINEKEIQTNDDHPISYASSAHIVFQKEVSGQRGQMTHITEISFIINRSEFNEFEKMSGVSLSNDFRDLTVHHKTAFNGEDRRKKRRVT